MHIVRPRVIPHPQQGMPVTVWNGQEYIPPTPSLSYTDAIHRQIAMYIAVHTIILLRRIRRICFLI